MTSTKCKTIRREIDEADQQLTFGVTEHLRGCTECRTFQAERQALHVLMASLDTVAAPPDFDFRLRARLARDKSRAHSGSVAMISRPIAAVAMVLLIAVAGIVIKSWLASSRTSTTSVSSTTVQSDDSAGRAAEKSRRAESAPLPSFPISNESGNETLLAGAGTNDGVPGNGRKTNQRHVGTTGKGALRSNSTLARKDGGSATRDSSISPAPVLVSDTKTVGSPVLVLLDPRALKISVANGSGTSRLISLPTVSFGSQRLMARESFQAPVTSAKGVW